MLSRHDTSVDKGEHSDNVMGTVEIQNLIGIRVMPGVRFDDTGHIIMK